MSEEHKPLPVAGYTGQSSDKVALANEGKELEERVLRWIEKVKSQLPPNVGEWVPIGETSEPLANLTLGKRSIQQGFMWSIRAIFQPQRIKLPEDNGG